MVKDSKQPKVTTIVPHHDKDNQVAVINRHSHFSSFNIYPICFGKVSSDELQGIDDYDFSLLIEDSLTSTVWANLRELSKVGYLKTGFSCQIGEDPEGPRVTMTNWLEPTVKSCSGDALFARFGELGEAYTETDIDGIQMGALQIASELILHDICQRGLIFSPEWHSAMIFHRFYLNSYIKFNDYVLIGVLSEGAAKKEIFESDALLGEKFNSNKTPRTHKATEENKAWREKRKAIVEESFSALTEQELMKCFAKKGGRLIAKKVAREILSQNPFENRAKSGLGVEAVAEIVRKIIKKVIIRRFDIVENRKNMTIMPSH